MYKTGSLFLAILVSFSLYSAEGKDASRALSSQHLSAQSLHVDWINRAIAPGEDFYAYANGGWQKQNPIPKRHARWDNFRILQDSTENRLNNMMHGLAENPSLKAGSIGQKIGDFYYSGMNLAVINREHYSSLMPWLKRIDGVSDIKALQDLLPELQLMGVNILFNFGSMQDFKDSQMMIAAAMQGGLGLPDRDYYCSDDDKFVKIRNEYVQHVARTLQLVGESKAQAEQHANTVMAMETALAKASMTQIAQRDPYAIYHFLSLDNVEKLTPHFSWHHYLQQLRLGSVKQINIGMPDFFKSMDAMWSTIPLADWKVYYRWHVLQAFSSYLSQAFVDEAFVFKRSITGVETLLPRWQRVVDTVNRSLDFAVGQFYVEHYFSEASKQNIVEIMSNIRHVFRQVLQEQFWMGAATKKAALQKLDLMTQRAGYPERWRDYSSLHITRESYVLNVIHANEFNSRYDLDKIGKPVDRSEWSMSPQTINAYYDPSLNSINILAGILQPPFFDPNAPAAVNYGAIGFVIGHEMTHGFDDQGALFDGYGNLKNWWTPLDMQQFKAATRCIAKQFSGYKVNGDTMVQGELVVGEAAADLGGVLLAWQAFHASKDYHQAKTIEGFTPDQQFFLSVAHVWAGNIRPELARHLVAIDPHPPSQYRVNGTLANRPEFQRAFSIATPSKMVHLPQCKIW